MKEAGQPFSLARQNAWQLAVLFIIFELVAAGAVILLMMAPMARRAAEDLAGLMRLSAQTRSELPPSTRPDFEIELEQNHLLWIKDIQPGESRDEWHGIYIRYVEEALAAKTGDMQHLSRIVVDEEDWFWATLPSGDGQVAVGFPSRRIGTHPVQALMMTLAIGLVLAIVAAIGLAKRITQPLARMEAAVAQVGLGEIPELLSESGPTELAALARRFNEMALQVQELLVSRTTMLAGISHDLRTPLARIRLALALMEEQPTPSLIARIETDVEAMDRLIGNVLNLARGLGNEAPEDIDIGAWAEQLAQEEYGERLQVASQNLPMHASVRPVALKRVVRNLIDNALQYGDGKAVELVVKHEGDEIHVAILDHGPGIPNEQLEAVFQPFHRVEASRSPATGGTGLGLAIVRQLANANGWRVELQNRAGGGLEARLRLYAIKTTPEV